MVRLCFSSEMATADDGTNKKRKRKDNDNAKQKDGDSSLDSSLNDSDSDSDSFALGTGDALGYLPTKFQKYLVRQRKHKMKHVST